MDRITTMEMATVAMMEPPSPAHPGDVIERAQAGDANAFETLYRENVGRVYAVCLRMVGNTARAEDLTQEAFVRAWQKIKSFRGDSAFSTWMHRLTVNLVLSELRSHSRRMSRELSTGDYEPFERGTEPVKPGTKVDLEKAIAALPEGARRVFVLHDIEGYRHREIASMLGIAQGTAKAQLHRARKILREALA